LNILVKEDKKKKIDVKFFFMYILSVWFLICALSFYYFDWANSCTRTRDMLEQRKLIKIWFRSNPQGWIT